MSESGNGEDQPQHGEPPTYQPPPVWQPPVPPPVYQPPSVQQPGDQQPIYSTYPPPGYEQPSFPPPPQYGPPGYPPSGYGYGLPPAPVPGGRVAGMGARFGGLVVDGIILAVPLVASGVAAGAYQTTTTCDAFSGICTTNLDVAKFWTVNLIGLIIGLVYSALLVGLQGQTWGHRVAGIRVVDADTGRVIGPGRAALRWLVLGITGSICTLGYWSPFFDSVRRQGWHDKAVNSVVIPAH